MARTQRTPPEVKLADYYLRDEQVEALQFFFADRSTSPAVVAVDRDRIDLDMIFRGPYAEHESFSSRELFERFFNYGAESRLTNVGSLTTPANEGFGKYCDTAQPPGGDAEARVKWTRDHASNKAFKEWQLALEQRAKKDRTAWHTLELIHKEAERELKEACKKFARAWRDAEENDRRDDGSDERDRDA
jgi:hypothetical protein